MIESIINIVSSICQWVSGGERKIRAFEVIITIGIIFVLLWILKPYGNRPETDTSLDKTLQSIQSTERRVTVLNDIREKNESEAIKDISSQSLQRTSAQLLDDFNNLLSASGSGEGNPH